MDVEDLKDNVKAILHLYVNRVNDLIDSLNNNNIEENILFCLNNKIYFCR